MAIKLDQQFINFAKFGDTKADGKTITLTQIDKWFKQAQVFDKKLTTTDTGITFGKLNFKKAYFRLLKNTPISPTGVKESEKQVVVMGKRSKTINFQAFVQFVEDLATQKKMDPDDIKAKLMDCGPPGTNKATVAVKTGGVDRLTDTSKYTGSHKERFDESGHGKGKEGRDDLADDSGYVGGYKNKDTYDKK